MKRKFILALAICSLLAAGVPVLAQVSANHDLSWHVIAGGGGKSASAGHTLMGAVGQPLTGGMSGAGHTLYSGFWHGGVVEYHIYLPLTLKGLS